MLNTKIAVVEVRKPMVLLIKIDIGIMISKPDICCTYLICRIIGIRRICYHCLSTGCEWLYRNARLFRGGVFLGCR